MIPTRETIDSFAIDHAFHDKMVTWLRSMHSEIDKLRADLDRANTEAALARDALAKATTPAPEREASIRAWEEEARGDGPSLLLDYQITNAVALMRRADGKELLRELRGKYMAAGYGAKELSVRLVDEMLARPEPSTVYSRGKTIAESADPPTAYYPPPPVEIWPEEMKRQTLVGKFEPAPVERPAAAVPDDTRELVAQLADVVAEFFVAPWCDRAKAIAAKLRGGA